MYDYTEDRARQFIAMRESRMRYADALECGRLSWEIGQMQKLLWSYRNAKRMEQEYKEMKRNLYVTPFYAMPGGYQFYDNARLSRKERKKRAESDWEQALNSQLHFEKERNSLIAAIEKFAQEATMLKKQYVVTVFDSCDDTYSEVYDTINGAKAAAEVLLEKQDYCRAVISEVIYEGKVEVVTTRKTTWA